jgi:hypothetical protein
MPEFMTAWQIGGVFLLDLRIVIGTVMTFVLGCLLDGISAKSLSESLRGPRRGEF